MFSSRLIRLGCVYGVFTALVISAAALAQSRDAKAADAQISNRYADIVKSVSLQSNVLSREALLDDQTLSTLRLSPDGKSLAYIEKYQGANNRALQTLWLKRLDNAALHETSSKLLTTEIIGELYWASDSQHIFIKQKDKLMLVAITANTRAKIVYRLREDHQEHWFGVNPYSPSAMILVAKSPHSKLYELYSVNKDGDKTLIYTSEHQILDVLLGNDVDAPDVYKVRVSLETINGVNYLLNVQAYDKHSVENKLTTSLGVCEVLDPCDLMQFNQATQSFYVLARFNGDLISLYRIDLDSGKTVSSPVLIHQDPKQKFDIANAYFLDGQAQVATYDQFFAKHIPLTEKAKKRLARIQAFTEKQGSEYFNLSLSNDLRHWLINYKQASKPLSSFELFSENEHFSISEKLYAQHKVGYAALAKSKARVQSTRIAVEYTVSDGMQQFGYLTYPSSQALPVGTNLYELPLIVMPHGGPWSRSKGDYNRLADFIASRAYVVFEPNFRASNGMGEAYIRSANKDFGKGRVQQDIIDGMHAVLEMGYGDANRKAIVGHSFGGFSVLGGLSFTPQLFEMGFAGAPPADLVHSISYLSRQDFLNIDVRRQLMLNEFAVDIDDPLDKKRLSAQSPQAHLTAIQRPVYIWAGQFDDRVDIRKVKMYASALRANDKEVKLFIDPYSAHSPSNHLAFDAYLYMLEEALHSHFGSLFEAEMSPFLQRYLASNTVINTINIQHTPKQAYTKF